MFNRATKKSVASPSPSASSEAEDSAKTPIMSKRTSIPPYSAPLPPGLGSPTISADTARSNARIERLLSSFADSKDAPTWLQPILKQAIPVVLKAIEILNALAPLATKLFEAYTWCDKNLPMDIVIALWGLTLCFFGGTFPLTLAAYEAFKISGWDTSRAAISDLWEQGREYRRASIADDKKDDDGNGVADVDEMSSAVRCNPLTHDPNLSPTTQHLPPRAPARPPPLPPLPHPASSRHLPLSL
jgi:hypothetical protein